MLTNQNAILDNSNNKENLNRIKIPAETKVAECINEEAGTGASIESGNQI